MNLYQFVRRQISILFPSNGGKKKKIPSCSVVIKTSQAPGLMSFYQGINESLIRKESWDSRPDVPRNAALESQRALSFF